MNKKILFIIMLILLPLIYADNLTINHTNVTMYPISFFTFNFTQINMTQVYNIDCLLNDTTNIDKCEIERTLESGETYLRNDERCNLNIKAPECQDIKIENKSYKIHWRLFSDDYNTCITYLNSNDTKCYPRDDDNYDYEKEYTIHCPVIERCQDPDLKQFRPLNLTDDNWYSYCLLPWSKQTEKMLELNDFYINSMSSKDQSIGSYSESNINLAKENAKLNEQLIQFNLCKVNRDKNRNDFNDCNDKLIACRDEFDKIKTSSSFKNFVFWALVIINSILLMGLGMFFGTRYILKMGDGK